MHAVRWGKRVVRGDTEYTLWHASGVGGQTLCHRPIQLMSEAWPFLPETEEDLDYIDCIVCGERLRA